MSYNKHSTLPKIEYSETVKELEQVLNNLKQAEYKQFKKEYSKLYQKQQYEAKRLATLEKRSLAKMRLAEETELRRQQKEARRLLKSERWKQYYHEYYLTTIKPQRQKDKTLFNMKQNLKHAEKVGNIERREYWTQQIKEYNSTL